MYDSPDIQRTTQCFRYPAVLEELTAEMREHVLRAIDSTPPLLLTASAIPDGAPPAPSGHGNSQGNRRKVAREKEEAASDKEATGKKLSLIHI